MTENELKDDGENVENADELFDRSAWKYAFGDHPKVRILFALSRNHPFPANPSSIVEGAGLGARSSWYDHKDELLESGLVVEKDQAGNSPMYALADDDVVNDLQSAVDRVNGRLLEQADE